PRGSEGQGEERCVVSTRGSAEKKRERNGSEDTPANRQASRLSTSGEDALADTAHVEGNRWRRDAPRQCVVRKLGHLNPPLTRTRKRSRARPIARRVDSALKPTICPTEAVSRSATNRSRSS